MVWPRGMDLPRAYDGCERPGKYAERHSAVRLRRRAARATRADDDLVRLHPSIRHGDVATALRDALHLSAHAALALLLLALLVPAPASAMRLFVANSGDDTVSVVDTDLDREVQTIPVGKSPSGIVLRADPPLVAVANSRVSNATTRSTLRCRY